mgnify:CR=1 FL=1
MSRVHTDQHYINVFHKDNFNFGPSKMTRSKGCNPDCRKAATLSSWLFLKYDMSYKAYRRKSTHRRQELRKEFEKDTGQSNTSQDYSVI